MSELCYNIITLFFYFSSLCSLGSEESNVCSLDLDLAYSVPQLYKARVFKIYDSYGVTSSAEESVDRFVINPSSAHARTRLLYFWCDMSLKKFSLKISRQDYFDFATIYNFI